MNGLFILVCTCTKSEMSLPGHEYEKLPPGKRKKCKVSDFINQGVGSSWGVKVLIWEMECLSPVVSHYVRQLRAMQLRALDVGVCR